MCDIINLKITKLSGQLPAQRTNSICNMFYVYLILCCVLVLNQIAVWTITKISKTKKKDR